MNSSSAPLVGGSLSGQINVNSSGTSSAASMAALKTWDTATTEEKLEKLRMDAFEKNNLLRTIESLEKNVSKLMQHAHADNGDIVVAISDARFNEMSRSSRKNSNYLL